MPPLTTTPQVFAILTSLLEERLGLWYSLSDKALFESKIAERTLELGFDSALDYYYYLRYDDPDGTELAALTECLVVQETFFFREYDQLDAAMTQFVAPLIEAGRRPRVWSAACATGEEPYTIAMWLDARGWLDAVEVIASDISAAALASARKGSYRARALRRVPDGIDPFRWLKRDGDRLIMDERIRSAIRFRQLNLMDAAAVRELGILDIVFCRNLLIYFRDTTVIRVVSQLRECLKPGGVLVVGVSESLMRVATDLVCEEHRGAFVYRKAP